MPGVQGEFCSSERQALLLFALDHGWGSNYKRNRLMASEHGWVRRAKEDGGERVQQLLGERAGRLVVKKKLGWIPAHQHGKKGEAELL